MPMEIKPSASPDRLAMALISALAVAFFFPALPEGDSAVVGSPFCDAAAMFYPHRAFANGELLSGRLPLWDPYIFCGHPFHGEGQGAVFYPANLLFAPLPPVLSMNLFALAHFAAAGVFFFLYLREMGLGVFASLFGALVYCFSSGPISRFYAGHYTIMPFLALVPAFLWLWERWRRAGGIVPLVGAALAYGGMVLSGYPQLLLYSTIYFGVHVLFAIAENRRTGGGRRMALPAAAFAVVALGGALLGAVQLFPSVDFARYSFRQQATYRFCSTFSFPPENLLTLLAPQFLGDLPQPGGSQNFSYWGRCYLWEMWVYIGILPLALALMAAMRVRARPTAAHAVAVPLFVILALGANTPLFRLLYHTVPFFNYFRGSSKFILYAQISLCVLAAIGAERLLAPVDEKRSRGDRLALLAVLGLMLILGAGLLVWFGRDPIAEGSAWRRFLAWVRSQGESYWESDWSQVSRVGESWATAARSVWRLNLLAAGAFVAVLAWTRIKARPAWRRGVLFALAIPELWLFSHVYLAISPVEAAAVPEPFVSAMRRDKEPSRVLSTDALPNIFGVFRLETVRGYAGNITWRYNNFLTAINGLPREQSMVMPPVGPKVPAQWLWANVRYLILHFSVSVPPGAGDALGRDGDQVLYRLRAGVPRAYFSARLKRLPTAEAALDLLESGQTTVFANDLIEAADAEPFSGVGPPVEGDRVEFIERLPGRVVLSTTAASPRLLVLSDSHDPNWRCRIDRAQAATIYPVNIAFRGVIVPAGQHKVEFRYAPASLYWGLATSCGALLAAAGLLVLALLRRWNRRGRLEDSESGHSSHLPA